MAIRRVLRDGSAEYLDPGEEIQAVFLAKRTARQSADRAVIATDRRLLLMELNMFARPKGVLAEAERETRFGPCRGLLHPLPVFGPNLDVHRRFFKDVADADGAAGFEP